MINEGEQSENTGLFDLPGVFLFMSAGQIIFYWHLSRTLIKVKRQHNSNSNVLPLLLTDSTRLWVEQ